MPFFSSPTSNILPSTFAPASVAMSRSDSRDSATSTTSSTHHASWDIRPRSSSSECFSSSTLSPHPHASHRRTSSSSSSSSSSAAGWTPSPYRSCLSHVEDSSSSYLSDDDLLDLPSLDVDLIESPVQKELSTEEQIELLRAYREREESSSHAHGLGHGYGAAMHAAIHPALHAARPEIWVRQHHPPQQQQKKSRVVRFATDQPAAPSRSSSGRRRPSTLRRC